MSEINITENTVNQSEVAQLAKQTPSESTSVSGPTEEEVRVDRASSKDYLDELIQVTSNESKINLPCGRRYIRW